MSRAAVLATLAAAATGVQVGAAMVATRLVIDQTGPATLAMLRYALGVALLAPFVLGARRARLRREDLLPVALLGIGQFGVLIALLNLGLAHAMAARAALVFALFPLLTLLLGAALGREQPTRAKLAGLGLCLLGIAVALGEHRLTGGGAPPHWAGLAAVLAAALTGAVCSVLYRPYLERNAALPVGALAMAASVLFLALLAVAEGSLPTVTRIDATGWGAIVFIGASSAVGYLLWLYALARISPTRVTVFLSLSPLTAGVLGAAVLHEPLTPGLLGGTALVAAGLAAVHAPWRHPARGAAVRQ